MDFNLKSFFPNAKRRSAAKAQRRITKNLQNIRINRTYLARKKYVPKKKYETAPGDPIHNMIDYRYTPKAIARNKLISQHRQTAWSGIRRSIRAMRPYMKRQKYRAIINRAFKLVR